MEPPLKEQPPAAARAAEKGEFLFALLRAERLEGFERSFKMGHEMLFANRYLAGISRRDVAPQGALDICARIGMPPKYVPSLEAGLEAASTVHFGFEQSSGGGTFKVYLEFARALYESVARDPAGTPVLLHLAYKWDVLDAGKSTIARYVCHPGLSAESVLRRVEGVYPAGAKISCETAQRIVADASRRASEPPMYLEVTEEGNPRSSFDVNLHHAGLRLREVEPSIRSLGARYAIPECRLSALYECIGAEKLGHLSGGMDREGRDFFTVYYEAGFD
jgi:hypothetical protein